MSMLGEMITRSWYFIHVCCYNTWQIMNVNGDAISFTICVKLNKRTNFTDEFIPSSFTKVNQATFITSNREKYPICNMLGECTLIEQIIKHFKKLWYLRQQPFLLLFDGFVVCYHHKGWNEIELIAIEMLLDC